MSRTETRKKEWTLVTGAAGFIAFHVIEALLRQGKAVVGVDNFDAFYDRNLKNANVRDLQAIARETGTAFEFRELDICGISESFEPRFQFGEIVHLGAKAGVRPSIEDPAGYLRANVEGTLRMLEFARHRKISRFIFGSSSSVYGDSTPVPFRETAVADEPISPYAASKRAGELYCRNYAHLFDITVASLRFFTVYGDRQRPDLAIHKFTRQIAHGETITLFGDGGTERDYTYVSDIVVGVMGAIDWARNREAGTYEVFNLGGSRTTTLKRLVELIETELGIRAKIKYAPMQAGDVERTYASVAKAGDALGYKPGVPIEEGIARFVEWYKESHPELFGETRRAA